MHHFFFGLVIVVVLTVFVVQDANKRGMNGVLWGLGTFFLCIVFLPLYLIVRKPLLMAPPPPGYPGSGYPPPPAAGKMCPACGKYHEGAVQFCPFCGSPQPQ